MYAPHRTHDDIPPSIYNTASYGAYAFMAEVCGVCYLCCTWNGFYPVAVCCCFAVLTRNFMIKVNWCLNINFEIYILQQSALQQCKSPCPATCVGIYFFYFYIILGFTGVHLTPAPLVHIVQFSKIYSHFIAVSRYHKIIDESQQDREHITLARLFGSAAQYGRTESVWRQERTVSAAVYYIY